MKYYKDEKLGYYVVNGISFTNKVNAIEYATLVNIYPDWVFNDSTFKAIDWTIEPIESLNELYARRARGLREKYDYLVLNYSGGGDSQNILDTFINNNIKLDEILIRWPKKASDHSYTVSTSGEAENFYSEWDLTLLPKVKKLAQSNPEIKIEFYDYSDDGFEFYKNDEWIYSTNGSHLNPCAGFHFYLGLPKYRALAERGIKVGHIFGVDKPRVILKDGVFYTYFLDILTGIAHFAFDEHFNEYNSIELFYWSPDSVQLLVKQTHTVMNFFKANKSLLPFVDFTNLKTPAARSTYENIIRSLIYPTWDITTFQVAKPSSVFYCEYDDWFFKRYENTSPMVVWKESLDYIAKTLDKKFLMFDNKNRLDNFVGFISPFYKLGTL